MAVGQECAAGRGRYLREQVPRPFPGHMITYQEDIKLKENDNEIETLVDTVVSELLSPNFFKY